MDSVKQGLQDFSHVKGVVYLSLVDRNAAVIEQFGDLGDKTNEVAGLVREFVAVNSDNTVISCLSENFVRTYVEFDGLNFSLIAFGKEHYVAVVSNSILNLGRLNLEIKKLKKLESAM